MLPEVMFVLELAGLAVFIIALVRLSLRMHPSKHDKEQDWYRDREDHNRRSDSGQATIRALAANINAIGDELRAQRRQQNHHDNRRALLEKVGVGAAIVAALLAGYSAWIFQGQLNEMQSEKRPWIAGGGTITPDHLTVSPSSQVMAWFQMEVTVLGGSPAYNVVTAGILIPQGIVTLERQKNLCDHVKSAPIPKGAILTQLTLFPGQKPTLGVLAIDEHDEFAAAKARAETKILPVIVGCIVYSDQAGQRHQTGFIYDLFRRDTAIPGNVKPFDLDVSQVWGADLIFRSDMLGGGPAD